jgi:hypothetical protein
MASLFLLALISPVCLAAGSTKPAKTSGGLAPGEIDVPAYFPIRQGDSWTYVWKYRIGDGPWQEVMRTRTFEGREFSGASYTEKLVSEDGDYSLFSLTDQGLRIHGVAEIKRDVRFLFDPPVVILTKQMKPGQPVVTTQQEEDGQHTRTFTSVLEGVVPVETPMGKFTDCLKIHWEMDGSVARQKTTYYLARGVGIVAYGVDARTRDGKTEVMVEARLKLAQLSGRDVTTVSQISELATIPDSPEPPDNPQARSLFREAIAQRYVWDGKFPGFTADFSLAREGKPGIQGSVTVDRQFAVDVKCADPGARAIVHSAVSQFVAHRKMRPFDERYAPGKATIGLVQADSGDGSEIVVNDKEAMGSRYRIHEREILKVSRSYGRMRFVTTNLKSIPGDDGRLIVVEYEIKYYSNETGAELSRTHFADRYDMVGGYWLPTGRTQVDTLKETTSTSELRLSAFRYLN